MDSFIGFANVNTLLIKHVIKSHFYIFSYIYIENEYIYSVFYEYNEEDKI